MDHMKLIQRNDVKAPGIEQMHGGSLIKSQNKFLPTELNFILWDV